MPSALQTLTAAVVFGTGDGFMSPKGDAQTLGGSSTPMPTPAPPPMTYGDLSSIQWKTQGDVTATGTSFVTSSDDDTGSNYAYSELSNVVSFRVKPNFDSSGLKNAFVGFMCGNSFTNSLYGTDAFSFATNSYPRVIFYNKGEAEITDPVMTLTSTTEIEFKIELTPPGFGYAGFEIVNIYVCDDDTAGTCTLTKTYAMGTTGAGPSVAATSCMAKLTMGTTGAGFEVKSAVTLDATTTATQTTTVTTTQAPTTTVTDTTTVTNTAAGSAAVASGASAISGLCVEAPMIAAAVVVLLTSVIGW